MNKVVFAVIGMVIGGTISDYEAVILGALFGWLIGGMVDGRNRAADHEASIAQLRDEVDDLKARLRRVSERIAGTETVPADVTTKAGVARANLPEVAAENEPPVVAEMVVESVTSMKAATLPPSSDVDELDLEMQALMAAPQEGAATPPSPPWQPPPREWEPHPKATESAGDIEQPPVFNPFAAAWNWLFGGNALVRVGVVVLFFGLAFLLKFAAENVVVPIEVRYVAVALGALAMLGIGWRLRHERPGYAMALQGLGVAVFYLVTFAAFRLHSLLPGALTLSVQIAICALSAALAVLQNARGLAVIGICGGFLAPVLTSTGGGSHVALFSYYALLNAGIFGIAWFRAWRPLNVLGFVFTFGIGSLWGSRNYSDELFATTEPFLLLFFALYLAISLLYARRRKDEISRIGATTIAGERIDYVDGTLVFGTPLVGFGLQYLMVSDMAYGSAFTALGLGLIYVPLALWLHRRGHDQFRLLVESFLALGVIFASLAIPLALDAKWTSAAWAAEGAGIYWIGLRQERRVARAFALLLQAGAGISFLVSTGSPGPETLFGLRAVFDGPILSALFVGAAGLFTAYVLRRYGKPIGEVEAAIEPLATVWGIFFLNLLFPLVLDLQWTSVAWALSGGATVVLAHRHAHAVALACGVALQFFGGLVFLLATWRMHALLPFVNGLWLGGILISAAGLGSAWRLHQSAGAAPARLATFGCAWGLAWWYFAGEREIRHHAPDIMVTARVLFTMATALLALAGGRLARWAAPVGATILLLPCLVLFAVEALITLPHPAANYGWLAWPPAIAVLLLVLRRQEGGAFAALLEGAHAITLLLVSALATWQTWWWFRELGDPGSAWPVLGWALAPLFLLALLGWAPVRARWPLSLFPRSYLLGAAPLAIALGFWVFIANGTSNGSAAPLPYLPLVNPLDLALAGALLVSLAWIKRAVGAWGVRAGEQLFVIYLLVGGVSFYWLNGVLLRTLHHWAGIPFALEAMVRSTLVQAALSLFWALLALGLMMWSTRRKQRPLWLTGGLLMAAVVVKLFLVDLSRVATVERIVSFMGVGVLLLVLGYFSPVPPAKEAGR